jgi:molybdenum cofactor guanylyltransferase
MTGNGFGNGTLLPLTGVVLAGGQNRRMGGESKALLRLAGQTFLARQLTEMSMVCQELLVITNEPGRYREEISLLGSVARCLPDLEPGAGPLSGLQAAMHAAANEVLWIVACDMPLLSAAAAVSLAELRQSEDLDAAIPRLQSRVQPLHGIYQRRCLDTVEQQLRAGDYRMMQLLSRLRIAYREDDEFKRCGVGLHFTRNVNDPSDYARLLEEAVIHAKPETGQE